jgi:hypothetical protein
MLGVCWMPWANVSCGDVRANPNLWQLAEYESALYAYGVMAVLIIVLGVAYMIHRHRSLALTCSAVALAATAAWVYFLIRRDDLVAQQMAMQGLGGDLAQVMQDVQLHPGNGFKAYPVGIAMALISATWSVYADRRINSTQSEANP